MARRQIFTDEFVREAVARWLKGQPRAAFNHLQSSITTTDGRGRRVVLLGTWQGIRAGYRRRADGKLKQIRPNELAEVIKGIPTT